MAHTRISINVTFGNVVDINFMDLINIKIKF